MGVGLQLVAIAFMVPLGISQAVRIRVSNLLGTFYPFPAQVLSLNPPHSDCMPDMKAGSVGMHAEYWAMWVCRSLQVATE